MKRILDPSFRYQPSFATDLRKTFERLRRERKAQAPERATSDVGVREKVLQLDLSLSNSTVAVPNRQVVV